MGVPEPIRSAWTRSYAVPTLSGPVDLKLDANEGRPPPRDWLEPVLREAGSSVHLYPKPAELEAALAEHLGVDAAQVLVTAGGDEAIERAVRTYAPGRALITPAPTFEMFGVYASLYGATVRTLSWGSPEGDDRFPLAGFCREAAEPDAALLAVVTPNSPTGLAASASDLEAVFQAADARPSPPLVLVDHAYVEFAEADLTRVALGHRCGLVVRTLSKAYGLAGLRVGYALGDPEVIGVLRRQGTPYPFSRLSLHVAFRLIREQPSFVSERVQQVRTERTELVKLFTERGHGATPSDANFVWVRVQGQGGAEALWRGLRARRIAVRFFDQAAPGHLRITCPADPHDFRRLRAELEDLLEDRS